MPDNETVVLSCPYCQTGLERPLDWFRQDYFTCPACGGGLVATQFAVLVDDLDAAFEASVAIMLHGAPSGGCGCGGDGCCKEDG